MQKNKNKSLVKKGVDSLSDSTIAFSKKLMAIDWIVTLSLFVLYIVFMIINAIHMEIITQQLIINGDYSYINSISNLFDLSSFGTLCMAFTGQLAVAEATYHGMAKSDHKLQYPAKVLESLPKDMQKQTDVNQLISNMVNIQ